MRFNRKLIIPVIFFAAFFLFCPYGRLSANYISYYVKPLKIYKGSVFLVIFENLNKDKKYILRVSGEKVYQYKLNNMGIFTIKLIGVSLNSPDKLKISLLENNTAILEDEFILYEKEKKSVSVKIKQEYVTPPKSMSDKLYNEYLELQKAKSIEINERYFSGAPVFPVTNGKIGTVFGVQRTFNEKTKSIHYGTDISSPAGTPIKALFKGKAVVAGDYYFTGKTVILHHGDGLVSLYSHLDTILVKENRMVEKGEKIGTVGSTGRATGPHLHMGAYVNRITVDPMSLFDVLSVK